MGVQNMLISAKENHEVGKYINPHANNALESIPGKGVPEGPSQ